MELKWILSMLEKCFEGYSSGGGIYIEYTSHVLYEYTNYANVMLTSCSFSRNVADGVSRMPKAEGANEDHTPFGRGGGFSIFFLGNASNNTVNITNCTFSNNVAAWGGAIYIRYRDKAGGNEISLENVRIVENKATLSGGGIIVTSTLTAEMTGNKLRVSRCFLIGNEAKVGGGFSQRHLNQYVIYAEKTTLCCCLFTKNSATLGRCYSSPKE